MWLEDPGRNGMQDYFFASDIQRMTRIRPSLETCNDVILRCKEVYDFPLAFVAPLQAYQYINHVCQINNKNQEGSKVDRDICLTLQFEKKVQATIRLLFPFHPARS